MTEHKMEDKEYNSRVILNAGKSKMKKSYLFILVYTLLMLISCSYPTYTIKIKSNINDADIVIDNSVKGKGECYKVNATLKNVKLQRFLITTLM